MTRNEQDPAILKQKCFHPPYCPNENCRFHKGWPLQAKGCFKSKGWAKTLCYPFWVKRFICLECKESFRYTSFKLDYREKRRGLNSKIFRFFLCGVSNREIGRQLNCSEHLVRCRLKKLIQWSLIRQTHLLGSFEIQEPVVYDGLEAYAKSQYDPNNIQHVVGAQSLFIYDFNFAPMNRKGTMSPRQKRLNLNLEAKVGRYSPQAIRTSSKEIFERIYNKRADKTKPLLLYSDQHFQYRRAIEIDMKDCDIQHITVSSKDTRNYQNILFPINHTDLLIRQHVGAFSRETICFSKTHERMIGKYALFMVWKNFFRTQFVKPHKRNPLTNQITPAMALGVAQKPFEFYEFFDFKRTLKQVPLNREWNCFYHEEPTYTRNRITIAA